jgi:hypothetical protein
MKRNLLRKTKRLPSREQQLPRAADAIRRVWWAGLLRDTLCDGWPLRTLNVINEGNAAVATPPMPERNLRRGVVLIDFIQTII